MDASPGPFVAVALGSNLGDRLAHLRGAVEGLAGDVRIEGVSSVYASDPVGYRDQPEFLNAVLVGRTTLEPEALLARGHALEARAGRDRPFPDAPRPLDVDLVLYGGRIQEDRPPLLPHPRWGERSFVLAPLAEVAPEALDPRSGRTVEGMWNAAREALPSVRVVAGPDALWREGP